MKHGTSRHPKLHDLMRRLATTRRDAIGLLELLWEYTAKYAPRGDIGRWSNADIAEAVDWQPNPDAMIAALVEARWLDASDEHRLIVHDWHEHAPEYIKKRLSRAGIAFVQTTADNDGQRLPTKSSQGKPSQVQPNPTKAPLPDVLDTKDFKNVWSDWLVYRKQARYKTYTDLGLKRLWNKLARWAGEYGVSGVVEAINTSIENGWKGLFEPKAKGQKGKTLETKYDKGF